MSAPEPLQYRDHYGRSTHITGRDGDSYFSLCGRNLPGALKSKLLDDAPADWQLCQRCVVLRDRNQESR